jgi:aryl-alcohol dehydrogenase-like predicted oxidoreductase
MTVLTRRLGRSNLQVSALGLGCWAIGGAMAAGDQPLGYASVDDAEAVRALHRAVELGVTLFDTADAYGAGHSERLLATVLADHPQVLVATKFGNTIDEATRQLTGVDTSPGYVRRALGGSLRRLGRDRVDLYQLHTSDVSRGRAEELLAALEALVGEGLIGWYGVSTDDPALAEVFADGTHCTAMQLQLNVLDDNPAMLAVCDRHDLAALCRSPLAMGLLGGRYSAASTLPADDIRGRQPEWLRWFADGRPNPDFPRRIDTIRGLLTAGGRTLAQGALGWIWAHHQRTIPLPGFRNTTQVEENLGALRHEPLSPAEHAAVERTLGREPQLTAFTSEDGRG